MNLAARHPTKPKQPPRPAGFVYRLEQIEIRLVQMVETVRAFRLDSVLAMGEWQARRTQTTIYNRLDGCCYRIGLMTRPAWGGRKATPAEQRRLKALEVQVFAILNAVAAVDLHRLACLNGKEQAEVLDTLTRQWVAIRLDLEVILAEHQAWIGRYGRQQSEGGL